MNAISRRKRLYMQYWLLSVAQNESFLLTSWSIWLNVMLSWTQSILFRCRILVPYVTYGMGLTVCLRHNNWWQFFAYFNNQFTFHYESEFMTLKCVYLISVRIFCKMNLMFFSFVCDKWFVSKGGILFAI